MEAIIVIVGFLGAGKTTLLKRLVNHYLYGYWNPYVILNDYQNAMVDGQYFAELLRPNQMNAISGSCICCSGITELRHAVNSIPPREKGITFIEANGTTDACTLLGFLGVGLKEHFHPPIQVAVVDTRHWQNRGDDNELEANQVQASSMVVLNFTDEVDKQRLSAVKSEIFDINPKAVITTWDSLNADVLPKLNPTPLQATTMEHGKSHWSSCSIDLPDPMDSQKFNQLMAGIPSSVLRVKGCTKLDGSQDYTFFERIPSGEVLTRPFHGKLIAGPKLITIGPGSDPVAFSKLLDQSPENRSHL